MPGFGRRPHPLGDGLWRADFDRVDRAAGRVLQVVAVRRLDEGRSAEAVAEVVEIVRAARELVWQCCVVGREQSPDAASEVPSDDVLAAAHRSMSRAATSTAQVAQALVMSGGEITAARRAAQRAQRLADEAATALGARPPGD